MSKSRASKKEVDAKDLDQNNNNNYKLPPEDPRPNKGFNIGFPVDEKYLIHIYQFCGLLLFFKMHPITLGIGIFFLVCFRPKRKPQDFVFAEFKQFIIELALMVFLLLFDNSANYVAVQWDDYRYDYTPLRDNFYALNRYLFPWWDEYVFSNFFPGLDNYFGFCIYFFVLGLCKRWDTKKLRLFQWAIIFCRLNNWLRYVRLFAYLSIYLPNPRPTCFLYKFSEHPDTLDMLKTAVQPRNVGGCGDLLVSGHGALAFAILYVLGYAIEGWAMKVISWVSVPLFINIVMERFHYSVDVFFALVLCHVFFKILYDQFMKKETEKQTELEKKFDEFEKSIPSQPPKEKI